MRKPLIHTSAVLFSFSGLSSNAFLVRSFGSICARPNNACRPISNLSSSDASGESPSSEFSAGSSVKEFLGKGTDAIVRIGSVLVAPHDEYHHFYRDSAIFIQGMGENEEGIYVIRGLIIDHPTPFTLEETAKENDRFKSNELGQKCLWRGGDKGGEGVVLIHNHREFGQPEIGSSGLYEGGWESALKACATGKAKLEDFKIFFNYCEFTEDELESLLAPNDIGDAWSSVQVEPSFVLSDAWDRGDACTRLRNRIRQIAP